LSPLSWREERKGYGGETTINAPARLRHLDDRRQGDQERPPDRRFALECLSNMSTQSSHARYADVQCAMDACTDSSPRTGIQMRDSFAITCIHEAGHEVAGRESRTGALARGGLGHLLLLCALLRLQTRADNGRSRNPAAQKVTKQRVIQFHVQTEPTQCNLPTRLIMVKGNGRYIDKT
jgi:hypothetical protein